MRDAESFPEDTTSSYAAEWNENRHVFARRKHPPTKNQKMKTLQHIKRLCIIASCSAFPALVSSCGTTASTTQKMTAPRPQEAVYTIASCKSLDKRAPSYACSNLQDRVRYGLFKRGLYAANDAKARRNIDLTITYYRDLGAWTRAWWGVMSGKDGIDVTVRVTDKNSGKVIGSMKVSTFNATAANTSKDYMLEEVSDKIVEFLVSGG